MRDQSQPNKSHWLPWRREGIPFRCWWSARVWDLHEPTVDLEPTDPMHGEYAHFYTYQCRYCGKEFEI